MSTVPLVSAAVILLAGPLAGQANLKLSGFAEASYGISSNADGDEIAGRLFERLHDQFMLNAFALVLDKPYDAARRSVGFHAEVLVGQNAAVIRPVGFDLGTYGDIPHLYVTLNLPTDGGNGLQFKVGRIPTLLGLEVIETPANPNWSVGNQFVFVENFTALGLSLETKLSDRIDAQLRVTNGWDVVQDNNRGKSIMARVGYAPNARTALAFVGFIGPEQPGDGSANRTGLEVLLWRKIREGLALWLQVDLGWEDQNDALPDPTQSAHWFAIGGWLTHDWSSHIGLALRADYVSDQNGARTSGVLGFPANTEHSFGSGTATLNIRSWPGVLLRPELRFDRSTLPSYDGEQSQITAALSLAYLF